MSNRRSSQVRRAETRRRILDCTAHLLQHRRSQVSIREVAALAGVTRQTVYDHFGSKANLVGAVAADRDRLTGIDDQLKLALAAPTAEGALAAIIRVWGRYVPQMMPSVRAMLHASSARDDAASRWWDRLDSARATVHTLVGRLVDEDALDPRWTPDQAGDILASLTHPRSWNDLVVMRGWSPDEFLDAQVEIATRVLLRAD